MKRQFGIDSNILIYAAASGTDARNSIARDIVTRAFPAGAIVPMQVLGEFLNACRRKQIVPAEHAIDRIVEWLPLFHTPRTEARHLIEAAGLAARYRLQFYDALVACVAKSAGAEYLLSEDMQDGMDLGGVTIIDPFADPNQALIDRLLD